MTNPTKTGDGGLDRNSAVLLIRHLEYLLRQYDRLLDMHANVVMDTPEERALHDHAVETCRRAATPVRRLLQRES